MSWSSLWRPRTGPATAWCARWGAWHPPRRRSGWRSRTRSRWRSAGQRPLVGDPQVDALVATVQAARRGARQTERNADLVAVHTDQVTTEEPREAGPVHVGHQLWQQLGIDEVLAGAGLSARTRVLTEIMTLNRLVCPLAEHAMPDWVRRTALADLLGEAFDTLVDESLYQNLDRLHPQRVAIEEGLAERERTLFNLDASLFLYDLTSTYFEGQCLENPQAQRGYSRDSRPDCKQVVMGLVLDRDGFPKAHEVFEGNRPDRTTVADMLDALEGRVGRTRGATVVVDRGMAFADNLQQIQDRRLPLPRGEPARGADRPPRRLRGRRGVAGDRPGALPDEPGAAEDPRGGEAEGGGGRGPHPVQE